MDQLVRALLAWGAQAPTGRGGGTRREADAPGVIAGRLAELGESFDLAEPFRRIREAIAEAQQAAR